MTAQRLQQGGNPTTILSGTNSQSNTRLNDANVNVFKSPHNPSLPPPPIIKTGTPLNGYKRQTEFHDSGTLTPSSNHSVQSFKSVPKSSRRDFSTTANTLSVQVT